jgi:hypothetical protein
LVNSSNPAVQAQVEKLFEMGRAKNGKTNRIRVRNPRKSWQQFREVIDLPDEMSMKFGLKYPSRLSGSNRSQ